MRRLALLAVFASACVANDAPEVVPELRFTMLETNDLTMFDTAWNAGIANPDEGVRYTFPVVSEGLGASVEIRLVVGRSTNGRTPIEVAGDVVLDAEFPLAIAHPDAGGRAEFPPLSVGDDAAIAGTSTIPWSYMCGDTVVVARAFQLHEGARDPMFLAATWVVANPDCAIF
jgi:hypothetical protein